MGRSELASLKAALGAKDALGSLRQYCPEFETTQNVVNNACGWAIERLTGQSMPAPA